MEEQNVQEKLIESCKASRVRRNISIVDEHDEELEKRKESRIPHNTRTNTSWAARVWRKWAEERNEMMEIIGDSGTLPNVNPDILNITENGELKIFDFISMSKVQLEKIVTFRVQH